jgi:hypothetical protein
MSYKFGNEPWIQIGTQKWQRRNLDATTYRNGDVIPYVADNTVWNSLTTGAWCYYNNDPANGKIYGKLYNWYAVNDSRGLAPEGWHIPTYYEYNNIFLSYLGGSSTGGKLKEIGTTHWQSPNTGATNSSKFTALPGGQRSFFIFLYIQQQGFWWTSTEYDSSNAQGFNVAYNTSILSGYTTTKNTGFSVRLIKD